MILLHCRIVKCQVWALGHLQIAIIKAGKLSPRLEFLSFGPKRLTLKSSSDAGLQELGISKGNAEAPKIFL